MDKTINLPEEYKESMQHLLKEEYRDYLTSFQTGPHQGLRVNTNKISVSQFRNLAPFLLKEVPWIENGFYYEEEEQPSKHPFYYAGLYYLQEPSAMTPANRLPICKDDIVLDMCAAPGGKATELGAKLQGSGLLVANDISSSRAQALLKNLELAGISNSYVTSENPSKLAQLLPETFDKILIDAPCSGEGMFHKDTKMVDYWKTKGPAYYSPIQKELLSYGVQMLKPGGLLLYSTCTFSTKENEENIQFLLEQEPSMKLVELSPYEGFSSGVDLDACVRIFPHKMGGEGHFLALLQKEDTTAPIVTRIKNKKKDIVLPSEVTEFLKDISYDFSNGSFQIVKEKLYFLSIPDIMPSKLRYLRTGLYMGDLKRNRFEPSQALAMALKKQQYRSGISLKEDDLRVIKYLKGETITVSEIPVVRESGWQLICVNDYPLGWGKLRNGILKNKYYPGWRWQ